MTATAEQVIFWMCISVLGYVYVGYPLLVHLISLLFPSTIERAEIEPNVTVLITAFNEEDSISEKLENTLRIDYPNDKLEILVASDGSTDRTDLIVEEFASRGVKLFRQEGRVGKTTTQNNAVEQAAGEIILFSDATTMYREDVFRQLLPAFADKSVGCVAGRLNYVDDLSTTVGRGAKSYWGYETFIKIAESRACSLIGASGCLYAVRRSAYEPMYAEACSDFLICTNLYRKGLRSVFAPDAVCFEHTNRRAADELRMRVRVISQTFTDLWRSRDMLNPLKSGFFAIELISHKVLRYAVPLILFVFFAASIVFASASAFYAAAMLLQLLFYSMAFIGWLLERAGKRPHLLAMPLYFVLANLASVMAFYKFLRGETFARWEPIRQAR
ncbi:MAG: glycosyltransferase family 2 protein [Chloracidobacterium sp.]|nr:glycosyltransferase family 2 protein [Chloracidobacterium sp.]